MNIIITGASKGIGYETVKELSRNKDNSVLALSRNEKLLKKLKNECETETGFENVHILSSDISDNKDQKKIIAYAKDKFDFVNVIINNAGVLVNKPFGKITISDMQKMFAINFYAPVRLVQLLLPLIKAGGVRAVIRERSRRADRHILNISSMGGFQGSKKFPGLSIYSSSKAALNCFTECLAEELKEQKIPVNCLAFGAVQTEMLGIAFPGYKAPLSAEEMGKFVAYFALNGQHYFNGKVLPVAGIQV